MNDILYVVLPFVISLVLTPLVKRIAYRLDAFAQVNERTVHSGKIVRIGGVAIYVAFIVSMAVFVKTDMAMNGILLGSTIVFIGGLIDDFVNLRPIYKFGFQVVAAIVLIASGVTLDVIRLPFGITISMGVVSVIVTFLWIAGITNAVNLIDGLDGLACGVSTISSMTMLVIALTVAEAQVAILMAALAGACIGFLPYNLNPAKIFMGDTGSLFLGGAVCGLAFALDVPLVIPLVGLIYVLETLSDIIQVIYFKATHGKRFFRMAPLHHHLELGGWSETKLFCVFSGATLVLCVLAFLGVMNRYPM